LPQPATRPQPLASAMVAWCCSSPSTGAIGYYVPALADEGLIGIMMASSPAYVAVEGGRSPGK
jgi:LDH2 family malate/lactate/ureidoglycolate dehydrogenase